MTERLTRQRVESTVRAWRGAADPYIPRSLSLLSTLKERQVAARATIDVAEAHKELRRRIGPDLPVADAVKQLEAVERAAVTAKKAAMIADLECAGIERQITPTFSAEMLEAWPGMVGEFAELLAAFTAAIVAVPAKVTDPKAAERAGSAVAHGWHQAASAAGRMSVLHRIAADARALGIFPDVPAARAPDWQWRDPRAVPSAQGMHRVAFLRDAIGRGCEPALMSYDELKARIQREAAAAAAERTAEVREVSLFTRPRSIAETEAEIRDAVARAEPEPVAP